MFTFAPGLVAAGKFNTLQARVPVFAASCKDTSTRRGNLQRFFRDRVTVICDARESQIQADAEVAAAEAAAEEETTTAVENVIDVTAPKEAENVEHSEPPSMPSPPSVFPPTPTTQQTSYELPETPQSVRLVDQRRLGGQFVPMHTLENIGETGQIQHGRTSTQAARNAPLQNRVPQDARRVFIFNILYLIRPCPAATTPTRWVTKYTLSVCRACQLSRRARYKMPSKLLRDRRSL